MNNRRRSGGDVKDEEAHRTAEIGVSEFQITDLPTTIILEIFFKLPIISIMNCKLVCTAWYKLLREPNFTDNYGRNSPFTHFVLPQYRGTGTSTYHFFSLLEFSENGDCIRTPIYPKWDNQSLRVIDTCNGLLCLLKRTPNDVTIYVSNPIMGECIGLPLYKIDPNDHRALSHTFGFSPRTNSFKVMRVRYEAGDDAKEDCEIFTVGVDNRWRSLEVNTSPSYVWCGEIVLNGVLHWVFISDEGIVWISTFDVEEEKFGQISPPPGLMPKWCRMNLEVLDNHLCLIDRNVESEIAIWTMKEYGVAELWTKVVLLKDWFPAYVQFHGFNLVLILKHGEILLLDYNDNNPISFNLKQKKCTKLGVLDVQDFMPTTYAPTFSPLHIS